MKYPLTLDTSGPFTVIRDADRVPVDLLDHDTLARVCLCLNALAQVPKPHEAIEDIVLMYNQYYAEHIIPSERVLNASERLDKLFGPASAYGNHMPKPEEGAKP